MRIPRLLIVVAVFCWATVPALAQSERSKTATYVKVQATAEKPNGTGHQVVTISLDIDEKYFLIGDKVPDDLAESRFRVRFLINGKPAESEITYPAGKIEKNKPLGDFTIYEGKVTCKGTIRREAGDTSPIELVISMQGYPQQRSS